MQMLQPCARIISISYINYYTYQNVNSSISNHNSNGQGKVPFSILFKNKIKLSHYLVVNRQGRSSFITFLG